MPEYSVHQLKPENFDILIPLMKDSFGMSVNVEYFKWKFLQNPAGPVVGFYALSETGECAAYYGAIAENYLINNKERTIYQSCDTMTHSHHRRKGLFQKLAITCYEYLRAQHNLFVIGFGGGQSTPGFLKFGWVNPFTVYFHFKPKVVCSIDKGIYKLTNFLSTGNSAVVYLTAPTDIMPLIQKGGGPATTIILNRSTAFLKWRLGNPQRNYKYIAIKENEKYTGYCIYYMENGKMMVLNMHCETGSAAGPLFNAMGTIVTDNKLTGIITFAQKGTNLSRLLLSNKFFINTFNFGPLREHLPFIFYAETAEMEMYNTPASWSITALDHDAY